MTTCDIDMNSNKIVLNWMDLTIVTVLWVNLIVNTCIRGYFLKKNLFFWSGTSLMYSIFKVRIRILSEKIKISKYVTKIV